MTDTEKKQMVTRTMRNVCTCGAATARNDIDAPGAPVWLSVAEQVSSATSLANLKPLDPESYLRFTKCFACKRTVCGWPAANLTSRFRGAIGPICARQAA